MRKNTLKAAALAATAGTMLGFGGCLGGDMWQFVWRGAAEAAGARALNTYVLDGVFLENDAQHADNLADRVVEIHLDE